MGQVTSHVISACNRTGALAAYVYVVDRQHTAIPTCITSMLLYL